MVDLPDGERSQFAPAQPTVGGGDSRQFVPLTMPFRAKRPGEPGDVADGRDLGRVYPERGLSRDADRACGSVRSLACQ